jgi:hypothetical protein
MNRYYRRKEMESMCEHHSDLGKGQVFINGLCRSCSADDRSEKKQLEIARKISETEDDNWRIYRTTHTLAKE